MPELLKGLFDTISEVSKTDQEKFLNQLTLRDDEGNTPLHIAIKNEAPKSIEMILKAMEPISHYRLSKLFYELFPDLFKSGVNAFEEFLGLCTFKTREMIDIRRLSLLDMESDQVIAANHTSLFTNAFRGAVINGFVAKEETKKPIKEDATEDKELLEKKEGSDEVVAIIDEEELDTKRVEI